MTEDFYDLLGVTQNASQEEIRKAFRKQVREYHPDLNDDPRAPAQFTALKKAYDTLGDPAERVDYDRMGHEDYVAKRINGLPSVEEWDIPEKQNGGRSFSDRRSADDGGRSTEDTAGTDRSETWAGAGGDTRTSATTGSRGASSSDSTRNAATSGRSRDAQSTSRGASATAAGTSGGSARGSGSGGSTARSATTTAENLRRRIQWLRRVSLGWPLIVLSDALYVAGLAFYLAADAPAVSNLVDRLVAAATGPESVAAVLATDGGISPLSDYIVADVTGSTSIGGPLLVLGMAFIPSVYFFIVRETRKIRTPWQPSYLYVIGAIAPLAGLIANVTANPPGLYVEVTCYVVLPLLSIVGLPFSAFVRPRIRRFVRKSVRKIRN